MSKIIHITSVHPVQDVRIFFKECLSLKEQGYEVALIAQHDRDEVIDGIQIYAIKKTYSRLRRMSIGLWAIYRKALSVKGDLYHFHDPELIPVALLLRAHGKKVLYDVHEDVPRDILLKSWIPTLLRYFISKVVAVIEFFAAKLFSAVVTVTPHINKRFLHINAIEVRNYPVLKDFALPTVSLERTALCYSGLITLSRGLQQMLDVAQATDTPLILAGQAVPEDVWQRIRLSRKVKYVGYLDQRALYNLYDRSFAGLALLHPGPTFTQSLPIKLFEYMAAGIPVIASNFALWRDIIEKHACGFCVDPLQIELICEKVNYLKNNPETARMMGERGRQAVINYYNWQTEVHKLTSLYEKIL